MYMCTRAQRSESYFEPGLTFRTLDCRRVSLDLWRNGSWWSLRLFGVLLILGRGRGWTLRFVASILGLLPFVVCLSFSNRERRLALVRMTLDRRGILVCIRCLALGNNPSYRPCCPSLVFGIHLLSSQNDLAHANKFLKAGELARPRGSLICCDICRGRNSCKVETISLARGFSMACDVRFDLIG